MIKATIERYLETGGVEDRPRSGRPKKLNFEEIEKVKKGLKRKHGGSTRGVAKRLKREQDLDVHHTTIWRAAKKARLAYRIKPRKPRLSEPDKVRRLNFARKRRTKNFWDRVLWSDEASFALYSDKRGEWVGEGQKPQPRESTKWPARIRVWAGICSRGKTKLIRIPRNMKAQDYIDMLRKKGIPQVNKLYEGSRHGWILMQDGDGSHTARITKKILQNEGVTLLDPWPARSPDLNPIENAWVLLEQGLQKYTPQTKEGLWRAMKKSWKKIDQDFFLNLINSVPNRLNAVIAAHGGCTKY